VGACFVVFGPVVSRFLTALSDLVDLGERGLAALQVLVAGMDVGLLSERRVVVTRRRAVFGTAGLVFQHGGVPR
jgi:hypothetical protein